MNFAIAIALLLLCGLLTLVSYVDRLYSEIGKFLSREFQDNIDAFEQSVEPRLKFSRERAAANTGPEGIGGLCHARTEAAAAVHIAIAWRGCGWRRVHRQPDE